MRAPGLATVALILTVAAGPLVWPHPAGAQAAKPVVQSQLLTVVPERLLTGSQAGKRLMAGFDTESQALAAENRKIEAELSREEKDLTVRRPKLSPEEFSKMADAFDTKVQEIRKTQDAKARDLIARREAARQKFLNQSLSVLAAIIRQHGATVLMDRATVFLSADSIDITDQAIRQIDAERAAQTPTEPPKTAPKSVPNVPDVAPQTPKQ